MEKTTEKPERLCRDARTLIKTSGKTAMTASEHWQLHSMQSSRTSVRKFTMVARPPTLSAPTTLRTSFFKGSIVMMHTQLIARKTLV